MEKEVQLLPIGSVVSLHNVNQLIMIYGRMQTQNNEDAIWDYVGCPYPMGYISKDYNIFFNNNQIHEIVFNGFENEAERSLKQVFMSNKKDS